jgi:hypothetical protein
MTSLAIRSLGEGVELRRGAQIDDAVFKRGRRVAGFVERQARIELRRHVVLRAVSPEMAA